MGVLIGHIDQLNFGLVRNMSHMCVKIIFTAYIKRK